MRITFYTIPYDEHGIKIKAFLNSNNIQFEEKIINDEAKQELRKISKYMDYNSSFLKIVKSHSISLILGFDEHSLNQLVEHIQKYNIKFNSAL